MLNQLRLQKKIDLFWLWVGFLGCVILVGVYAAFLIFTKGLVVTNLSDGSPWGLWIILDLSCIGLSAGAFSLSAITYLLGQEAYKPVARVAVFIGILGYSGALMALILDIGRPDRFWHGWVFWNVHSMLWEVTMCITLYFSVLALEVLPMVVELPFLGRFGWLHKFAHEVHRVAPVLAVVGLGLSLLHQSSLGGPYDAVAVHCVRCGGGHGVYRPRDIDRAVAYPPLLDAGAHPIWSGPDCRGNSVDLPVHAFLGYHGWQLWLCSWPHRSLYHPVRREVCGFLLDMGDFPGRVTRRDSAHPGQIQPEYHPVVRRQRAGRGGPGGQPVAHDIACLH